MSATQSESGRVAEQYVRDNPGMYKRAIARLLYKDRPDLFSSYEAARTAVRYYTGTRGDTSRSPLSNKYPDQIRYNEDIGGSMRKVMESYYLTPESTGDTSPVHLAPGMIGIISDVHIPYHDLEAVYTALEYMDKKDIDTLLINGDLVDFYQISRFSKDPTRANVLKERDMTLEFFEMLRAVFPDVQIVYKIGNHEERFDHFMMNKAKELYGIEEFSFKNLFHLDDYDIELVGGRQVIKAGKLDILHGHEFGQSFFNPVNPARGLFLRAKSSCLAGHNHQTSEHHENNLKADSLATWSTGCLCDLRPEYRPFAFTKWNHGAAIVEVDENGGFLVNNFRIIDGKIR